MPLSVSSLVVVECSLTHSLTHSSSARDCELVIITISPLMYCGLCAGLG